MTTLLPHGPHAGYVLAAYGVSAAGLAAMTLETLWRAARARTAERRQTQLRAGRNPRSVGAQIDDPGGAGLVSEGDPRSA